MASPRSIPRRVFLAGSAAGVASAAVSIAGAAQPNNAAAPAAGFVDTNVSLGPWATRRSSADSARGLAEKLRRHGVTSAWTSSFDGALHTDLAAINARLADACAREGAGILRPFGVINPTFPDWEEDLRRCQEVHRMRGVRLFPNYHGYPLDDPRFAALVDRAAQRGLLVQIASMIEDDRSQNPSLTAAPVQPGPLLDVLQKIPRARVMLLNSGYRVLSGNEALLKRLVGAGVGFEIATLEGVAGIEALLRRVPQIRLSFGSHAPYFYFEAALLKLQESALTPEQWAAIRHGNAEAALAGTR